MRNTKDFNQEDLVNNKLKFNELIVDIIATLEKDGMPMVKKMSPNIKIENRNYQTQTQLQTQSQHQFIDIVVEAIRNELSDEQIQQLRELHDMGESKGNIVKKIFDFGKNTASNILANIIVNEKFWTFLDTISKG